VACDEDNDMNAIDEIYSKDPIRFAEAYFRYLAEVMNRIDKNSIKEFIITLLEARETGNTVFFIGNGGSAATASHFANDLAIGTRTPAKPFRVLALTDNVSVMTAIANDDGYEVVFSQQLEILGKAGDVLVAISASGNSPNLVKAFETAKRMGIRTVALTAFDGGRIKQMADQGIHVPTGLKEYGPAEDAHMILDHLVHAYLFRYIRA
jgi:D-sedoheptulose 7-phosphate isomerase